MQDIKQNLADAIRKSRTELGLSQEKLAEILGFDSRTILNIENGRGNPKFEKLYPLVRHLNISADRMDCQHFFRQIFLGYFSDIVQAFDTLRKNVCGDDYTSLHNPIVLSSVLPAYGMFHSIQILFL